MAYGWWERLRMAHDIGITSLDGVEHDYNTPEGEALAAEWKSVSIRDGAEISGQQHFYKVAYRHGSAFEHSDSWSVQSFAEVHEDRVELHVGASTADVDSALFLTLFALYSIIAAWAQFYGFEAGTFDQDAQHVLEEAFGVIE
jgi:hypothetical protein